MASPAISDEWKERLADEHWRLNNLYYITDKQGKKVKFKMNWAQEQKYRDMWYLNIDLKARQLGMCLDPNTRVLTADCQWVKIKDLRVSDRVVSVDEMPPGGRGKGRRMRTAVIEGVRKVYRDAYRISFNDGRSVICTDQHPWLTRKTQVDAKWRTISGKGNDVVCGKIKIGTQVRWVTKPWAEERTYEDGWFGGIIDGEGSMAKASSAGAEINVSQVQGPVYDRMVRYLSDEGYNYRVERDNNPERKSKHGKKAVDKLCVSRMDELFRLVGVTQPSRFKDRDFWEGKELPGKKTGIGWATVTSIEHVGKRELIDLQTSTGTYIAEGFVSHNTTFIQIFMLDRCLFNPNTAAGVIAHNREDAEDFFNKKIKFAYDNLPDWLKKEISATTDSAKAMSFNNGSSIRVGTSLRSGTYQYLHISEFGKICAKYPDKAQEIITGALNTVVPGRFVFIESTAEGAYGAFYDMCQEAKGKTGLTKMDYRFFFFPWWKHPDYVLDDDVEIDESNARYFDTLAAKGIELKQNQKNWYVKKKAEQGSKMGQEYPSTPEEAFQRISEHAVYGPQFKKVREDGRITQVPYNPAHPVFTFWDLGRSKTDATSIWFMQHIDLKYRFIRYYQNFQQPVSHYAQYLQGLGYAFGRHYLPHDGGHNDFTMTTYQDHLKPLVSAPIEIVPRVAHLNLAIEAVRDKLPECWFDEDGCDEGIIALEAYRYEYSERDGAYKEPRHDWASHGASAFAQFAQGFQGELSGWGEQHTLPSRRGNRLPQSNTDWIV